MSTEKTQNTKVVTGLVRFSYLQVFEPKAVGDDDGEKKYSVSLIIPKDDKTTLAKIKKAIQAAIDEGKTTKFAGKTANLKTPLRDGDEERADDPTYKNAYFVSATSKTKPGLVDRDLNAIIDQDDLYSGCYGRASINFYPFNTNGNKGVACGLNNLQKLKDGEPLSGRSKPEDDFADDFEDEDLL